MTYRGHIRDGIVVLDPPAELPEGAAVEVNLVAPEQDRPAITSIDQLRGEHADDAFGDEFEETIRKWRNEPWRTSTLESLE